MIELLFPSGTQLVIEAAQVQTEKIDIFAHRVVVSAACPDCQRVSFSMAAEIERDLISKRTKEALAAKKRAGIKLGRPRGSGKSKLDKYRPEIEALLANGSTQKFIAQRYNTTEANLSRWLKKHGLRRNRS